MIGSYTHYVLLAERWSNAQRCNAQRSVEQAAKPQPHVGDTYPWIVYGRERADGTRYGVMNAIDGRDTDAQFDCARAVELSEDFKARGDTAWDEWQSRKGGA